MTPAFSIPLAVVAAMLLWEAYNCIRAMSALLAKQKLAAASVAFIGGSTLTGLSVGLIYLAQS